jgi:hypothetical protein
VTKYANIKTSNAWAGLRDHLLNFYVNYNYSNGVRPGNSKLVLILVAGSKVVELWPVYVYYVKLQIDNSDVYCHLEAKPGRHLQSNSYLCVLGLDY